MKIQQLLIAVLKKTWMNKHLGLIFLQNIITIIIITCWKCISEHNINLFPSRFPQVRPNLYFGGLLCRSRSDIVYGPALLKL